MKLTIKEIRQRHFDKVYKEAPFIECACGCGEKIKSKDKYGRDKKYISGHNTPKKYDNPTQYKREWNKRNRKQMNEYRTNQRHIRKVKLINLLGGKCNECGVFYDKTNGAMFHFHHKEKDNKNFGIATRVFDGNWGRLLLEVKKCLLLCANCHAIEHSGKF